jgi:hypothetical protein
MEKKKILIVAAVLVTLGLLLFFFNKRKQGQNAELNLVIPQQTSVKRAKSRSAVTVQKHTQSATPALLNPSTSAIPGFLQAPKSSANQPPKLTVVNYAKALRKFAISKKVAGKTLDNEVNQVISAAKANGIRVADVLAAYYNTYKGAFLSQLAGKVTTQYLTYLTTL